MTKARKTARDDLAVELGKLAIRELANLIREHLTRVVETRRSVEIEDFNLIAVNAAKDKRIDQHVRDQFASLHDRMRDVIVQTARKIEEDNYQACSAAIGGFQLSRSQDQQARALIEADKAIHTSYQSLFVAVDMFRRLNNMAIREIGRYENNPTVERNLVLQNALLVYELTDFVIHFIEKFGADGLKEVDALHKKVQNEITSLRREQKVLSKQAESPDISESQRQQTKRNVQNRLESLQICENEWNEYMNRLRGLDSSVASVRKSLANLKLQRNDARSQLKFLQIVAITRIFRESVVAIEATANALEGIQLAELSPERVKRLIGIT